MVQRRIKKLVSGQLIVELLLAFGLSSILLPALLTGFVSAIAGREVYEQRLAATALLREAEEAIRSFRNEDWQNIAVLDATKTYFPSVLGTKWVLAEGSGPINGFTRGINVFDVYRDVSRNIVDQGTPGATFDPSTRKFQITVSWPGMVTRSVDSTIYITRYSNTFFAEGHTAESPSGGFKDWCTPVGPSVTNVNIPHQAAATSIQAFESTDGTGNRVLMGTGASADSPAFTNVKIIGNNPPTASILGDYDPNPQIKVNGLSEDANYGFLATDSKGIVILDLRSTPYQQKGSFNPQHMKKVNDVYVVGNTGYAVTEDKLYIFTIIINPDGSVSTTHVGNIDLTNGARVVVDSSNQYAYVPNPDTNGELKIIDVHSHPSSLTGADVKNVNVDGGAGKAVFINASATRAYLATANSLTQPEFFIIDITDKANPVLMPQGTYDTGDMGPRGVTIVSGLRAIIVGTGGHEYQVFVVADDKVAFCPNHALGDDFLNIDSGIYAISSVLQADQHAYSYITTGDTGAELKIIEGGPGTGGVGGNGTYESPQTLSFPENEVPGHDVVFNSFTATVDPNLSYKIAIKHGVGGSCSGVTFSDSDFTSFVPGPLPLATMGSGYTNPGECLRYRAINSGTSPITFTINFNYSP